MQVNEAFLDLVGELVIMVQKSSKVTSDRPCAELIHTCIHTYIYTYIHVCR